MTLKINGTDVSHYIKVDGVEWSETDIHSDDSGRDLSGVMHVTVIGSKTTLGITCTALTADSAKTILDLIRTAPPLAVTYTDPVTGVDRTGNFYVGDRSGAFLPRAGGVPRWQNIAFTLIEC